MAARAIRYFTLLGMLAFLHGPGFLCSQTGGPAPGISERKIILDQLRQGVRHFKKYRLDFDYGSYDFVPPDDLKIRFVVSHLKAKNGWAWVEAGLENYALSVCALLHREEGGWNLKALVNPDRVVCKDHHRCLDVQAYVCDQISRMFPSVPAEIFPPIDPQRDAVLRVLLRIAAVDDSKPLIFRVGYFKSLKGWAWVEAHPRTLEGGDLLEPIHALLRLGEGGWRIETLKPEPGECEDDPECVDNRKYYRKLRREFPSIPAGLFPVSD